MRVGALVDEQHAILIEQPTAPTRLSKARLYTLARVDGEEDVANFGMLGADDDGNNLRASPVNGELLERSIFTVFGAFGLPRLVVRVVCDRVEPMRVAALAGGEEITRPRPRSRPASEQRFFVTVVKDADSNRWEAFEKVMWLVGVAATPRWPPVDDWTERPSKHAPRQEAITCLLWHPCRGSVAAERRAINALFAFVGFLESWRCRDRSFPRHFISSRRVRRPQTNNGSLAMSRRPTLARLHAQPARDFNVRWRLLSTKERLSSVPPPARPGRGDGRWSVRRQPGLGAPYWTTRRTTLECGDRRPPCISC